MIQILLVIPFLVLTFNQIHDQFPSDGVITCFNWYSLSDSSFNVVIFGKISCALCEIKHHYEVDDAIINSKNSYILNQPVQVKKGWSVGFHCCNTKNDFNVIGKSPCAVEVGSHVSNEVFKNSRFISFTLNNPEAFLYHFNVKFLASEYTMVSLDGNGK